MSLRTRVLPVLGSVLFAAGALSAQQRAPRFVLPAETMDYAAIVVPDGHPVPLPLGNGAGNRRLANERANLGRVLFYDRLLSQNQTRSCSSCHQQDRAFADGLARSRGFGARRTKRNSMAIGNLGFREHGFFWDERAATLEEMVLMPIQDPIEMGMSLDAVVARLRTEPGYAALFGRAFGDAEVTAPRIALSLAQFVRSIVSLRSKYDEGLAATGDANLDFPGFTAAENRGKRLFFGGERSCAACHMHTSAGCCGPIISQVMFEADGCRNNGVDAGRRLDDPGRAGITGKAEDRGKFRAPSLRNIELTGPYMHDGRFATLEDVVQFYANRVSLHPTLDPLLRPSRVPRVAGGWGSSPTGDAADAIVGPAPGLPMSSRERADLVAFLKTLTDWHLVRDPRFADPFVTPSAKSPG